MLNESEGPIIVLRANWICVFLFLKKNSFLSPSISGSKITIRTKNNFFDFKCVFSYSSKWYFFMFLVQQCLWIIYLFFLISADCRVFDHRISDCVIILLPVCLTNLQSSKQTWIRKSGFRDGIRCMEVFVKKCSQKNQIFVKRAFTGKRCKIELLNFCWKGNSDTCRKCEEVIYKQSEKRHHCQTYILATNVKKLPKRQIKQ